MRPSEIDYTIERKHYFDLASGEVLQGRAELSQYLGATGVDRANIVELGQLIRDGIPEGFGPFEALDTSLWLPETYKDYGRWLSKTVQPPPSPKHKRLNRCVLDCSYHLGVGPSRNKISTVFNSLSEFYRDIGETDVRLRGLFTDWELEDFVRHIRKIGGDKRPTMTQMTAAALKNPSYPRPGYTYDRFRTIGGLRTLFELAGYPVIERWDPQDYIDWGVRFMEANHGITPTSRMAEYFSSLTRGPSTKSIMSKFIYIRTFQAEVQSQYYQKMQEKSEDTTEKLARLERDLEGEDVPARIFYKKQQDENSFMTTPTISELLATLGPEEVIKRYAMFKVLEAVIPYASDDSKVKIIDNTVEGRKFIAAIRQRYSEEPGKIENAALTLGFFDDIWPMNDHLTLLKLDDGYEEFHRQQIKYERSRRERQKQLVA